MHPSTDWKTRFADIFVLGLVALFLLVLISTARHWTGTFHSAVELSSSLHHLPIYAFYSLSRTIVAYLLSLLFSILIGYAAAKVKFAERLLLPLIAIGQSIPSMAIFSVLLLGLITLFPEKNIGFELACVFLIFFSQTWNMALSFYSSLKLIPTSFYELSELSGMSRWKTFYQIEFPAAVTGLAWNSLLSVAGGWFFLTAVESFSVKNQDFRLPGLRSFMSLAVEENNHTSEIAALLAMLAIILFMDFIVWRPIIAFTRKFSMEQEVSAEIQLPFIYRLIRESHLTKYLYITLKFGSKILSWFKIPREKFRIRHRTKNTTPLSSTPGPTSIELLIAPFVIVLIALFLFLLDRFYLILKPLNFAEYLLLGKAALATFLRVSLSVAFATLISIPIAVGIGLSTKWTQIMQPIIQVGASFPAPMIFPILIGAMTRLKVDPGFQSGVLMLFCIQWYILFNVLGGAIGISKEIRENYYLMRVPTIQRWKQLYLPSIFPALTSGVMSATGRAWNASVVVEYFQFKDQTLSTFGLGSLIRQAVSMGQFSILTAGVFLLIGISFVMDRLLWRKILWVAETRYRFER